MTSDRRNTLAAGILGVVLALQAGAFYAVATRREVIPDVTPLSSFPATAGEWIATRDLAIEKDVQDVLRADDTLNRIYVDSRRSATASLFIAFFRTQRYGQAPHSPKNCLPGAGWQPSADRRLAIPIPGRETPIVVNEYVIIRGDQQSVVLYWYQSHQRVIAGELAAKFWLVRDAIQYRRSDTALVRVIVPLPPNTPPDAAEATAVGFVQSAFPEIARQLPQ